MLEQLGNLFKHKHWLICSEEGDIKLRALEADDIYLMDKWFLDLELVRYAFGFRLDLEDYRLELTARGYHRQLLDNRRNAMAICHEQLGLIGITRFDLVENSFGKIALAGIMLGEERFRGQGFGYRTIQLVSRYLFENIGVDRMEMETANYNEQAIASFTKAGLEKCAKILATANAFPEDTASEAPRVGFCLTRNRWESLMKQKQLVQDSQ